MNWSAWVPYEYVRYGGGRDEAVEAVELGRVEVKGGDEGGLWRNEADERGGMVGDGVANEGAGVMR